MLLTKAIANNRDANNELLISAQNAMFRLYEFTHLDGVIKDFDIDCIAGHASMWQMEFDTEGYPVVTVDEPEVRKMVRDAIRTSINLLDVRKEYADEKSGVR